VGEVANRLFFGFVLGAVVVFGSVGVWFRVICNRLLGDFLGIFGLLIWMGLFAPN